MRQRLHRPGGGAGLAVALDDLLGEREGLLAGAEVHRHAAAPGRGRSRRTACRGRCPPRRPAWRPPSCRARRRPVERTERLHDAVAVAARPGERPLGELLGLGETTGPQPQVRQQGLHHQPRPTVAAPGVALHGRRQRLGLVEPALEVEHPGEQAIGRGRRWRRRAPRTASWPPPARPLPRRTTHR